MSVVAVANAAGSAGKTTTATSLAATAALNGYRVLLVDLDGQATATEWVTSPDMVVGATSGDVLLRRAALSDAVIGTTVPGLQLLPAARSLDTDQIELMSVVTGREQRLRLALRDATADTVILDCPGQISTVTVSALVAATYVVAVTQPTLKELRGLPALEDVVRDIDDAYGTGLSVAAVVPCMVPPRGAGALYEEAMTLLRNEYGDLVAPPVRRSVRVPEAHAQRRPVVVHDPTAPVAEDYRAVYQWLAKRGVW